MIEEFIEINKLILRSQEEKEKKVDEPIIKQAKERMKNLKDNLIMKLNIDQKVFQGNLSTGRGNITLSPWIGFLTNKDADNPEGIYMTLIFLPQNNSIFLTIQGKSENYNNSKIILNNVFTFYQEMFEKIKQEYNFTWNNSYISNKKLIKNRSETFLSNSYLFTSIFYELIDLDKISDEELVEKIKYLFRIFSTVDLFYENPKILKIQLDDYLLKANAFETNELKDKTVEEVISNYQSSASTDFNDFLSIEKNKLKKIGLNFNPIPFISGKNDKTPKHKKQNNSINSRSNYKMTEDQIKAINDYKKFIGNIGEKAILKYEIDFLLSHNKPELSKKVKHIAEKDESKGYDILSYDLEGNEKYIEVKTTTQKNVTFYISENEKKYFENEKNYFIYFLGNIKNKDKICHIFTKNDVKNFIFKPMSYKVTVI